MSDIDIKNTIDAKYYDIGVNILPLYTARYSKNLFFLVKSVANKSIISHTTLDQYYFLHCWKLSSLASGYILSNNAVSSAATKLTLLHEFV